eukprot:TRINITY_DN513_c0_g1_i2.p1 TRINITY_DN513_c0_g1~~TRINITY_DN513_c0_g1_i2.p1  ORF type:complete len:110 (+),score=14.44 TRINITY_DN513_c0_g1_i2:48-377(+)
MGYTLEELLRKNQASEDLPIINRRALLDLQAHLIGLFRRIMSVRLRADLKSVMKACICGMLLGQRVDSEIAILNEVKEMLIGLGERNSGEICQLIREITFLGTDKFSQI